MGVGDESMLGTSGWGDMSISPVYISLTQPCPPCPLVKLVPSAHLSLTPNSPPYPLFPNIHMSDKCFGGQVGVGDESLLGTSGWGDMSISPVYISLTQPCPPCPLVKIVPRAQLSLTPTCLPQTFLPNTHMSDKCFGGQVGVGDESMLGTSGLGDMSMLGRCKLGDKNV